MTDMRFLALVGGFGLAVLAAMTADDRRSVSSQKPRQVTEVEEALSAHRQSRFADLPYVLQEAAEWLAGLHKQGDSEAIFARLQAHPAELRALSQILGKSQGDYARKLAAFSLGYLEDVTLADFNAVVENELRHVAAGDDMEPYLAQSTIEDLVFSAVRLMVRDPASAVGREFLVRIVEDVVKDRQYWNTSNYAMASLMHVDAEAYRPLFERWAARVEKDEHYSDLPWIERIADGKTDQIISFIRRKEADAAERGLSDEEMEYLDWLIETIRATDIEALRRAREEREAMSRAETEPSAADEVPEPPATIDVGELKAWLDQAHEPWRSLYLASVADRERELERLAEAVLTSPPPGLKRYRVRVKALGGDWCAILKEGYRKATRAGDRLEFIYAAFFEAEDDPAAIDLALSALDDRARSVRYQASRVLGYARDRRALPALRERLVEAKDERDVDMFARAIRCIETQNPHFLITDNADDAGTSAHFCVQPWDHGPDNLKIFLMVASRRVQDAWQTDV